MPTKTREKNTRPQANKASKKAALGEPATAVYLTEVLSELNEGAMFLDQLSLPEIDALRRIASSQTFDAGETVFLQGDRHNGIFLIESGRVRTYYASPSGREITLAFWTPGHFVGGPEIFGGGLHVWSANAMEPARLSYLPGGAVRQLAMSVPAFAICLIEGLVAKGKCYSALVQMLGTRSATERLSQLLVVLAKLEGSAADGRMIVHRRITHEQLASIVGATRQWVTSMLARLQARGIIQIERGAIIIERADLLQNADF